MKVDFSNFFEIIVYFCFLLQVVEKFISVTEIVNCCSFVLICIYIIIASNSIDRIESHCLVI